MKQISGNGTNKDGVPPLRGIRRLVNTWAARALMVAGLAGASLAVAAVSFSNTTLFTFDPSAVPNTTGAGPNGQMIQASDGNYYGVTCNGGTNSSGVIWQITPAGQETVLHTFTAVPQGNAQPNADGGCPQGVVQGADSKLYGVAKTGGSNGTGVVFSLALDGSSFNVMHNFGNGNSNDPAIAKDGRIPYGAIVPGADGSFYGTTLNGGTVASGPGTIFSITPSGTYQQLYSFGQVDNNNNEIDGEGPLGNLVQGADGDFYGVTFGGGTRDAARDGSADGSGGGIAYRFDPTHSTLTVLHAFKQFDGTTGDGYQPFTNLVETADGALYGMTAYGGSAGVDNGTLFRVSSTGAFTLLSSFTTSDQSNGTPPQPRGLMLGSDGNIYGTTLDSDNGAGIVFQLVPNADGAQPGTITTVHEFEAAGTNDDSGHPGGPTIQGSDGSILGPLGGDANSLSGSAGEIFRLATNPALAAPVQLTLDHPTLTQGQSPAQTATLTWNVLNATSQTYSTCFGSDGWSGSKGASGSQVVASSASGTPGTYRFALTCGGVETSSITLTILPPANQTPAPTVSITASPTSIVLGDSATLNWSSTNATSCTASGAWNGPEEIQDTQSVTPQAAGNFTYTLSCTGAGGTAQASATVMVQAAAPTVTISANPTSFYLGNSTMLQWSSTNATSCTASGGWSGTQSTNGSSTQTPGSAGSVTYKLTCSNDSGQANASVTVTVKPLPTVTISVNPTQIVLGNTATLTWSSTNATSCNASNQTGPFSGAEPTSGTLTVKPTTTGDYTYYLSCSGDGGTTNAVAHATLTVTAPVAPTVTISVNPSSITVGSSATLMWSSTNATSCTASNSWSGSEPTSGMLVLQPELAGTYTYTLTCTSDGGQASASTTLTANAAGPVPVPPTLTIGFNPSSIVLGTGGSTLSWSSTGATSCDFSGSPVANHATSGSFGVGPLEAGDEVYTMTCTGAGGSVTRSATLHVTSPEVVNPPPPVNPPPTGSINVPVKAGGGAFGAPVLLGMLGLAGLRRRRKAVALLLGLSLSGIGIAQADEAPLKLALDPVLGHLYGGVRLGEMNLARDNGKLYRELHNAGYDVALNQHKNAFAGTAYLGFQLDPLVGFELGYTHRDDTVTTITGAMPANLQGLLDTAVKQQKGFGDIYSASIRLHGEILPRLVLSPRLGMFYWTDKTTAQADGLSAAATHGGGGITVGTSVNYRIWRGLEVGTSIDFFGGNRRNDGTLFAGNVEWDFGK